MWRKKNDESHKMYQEYKIRHDWVGKVIHGELFKSMKLEHTTKQYLQRISL